MCLLIVLAGKLFSNRITVNQLKAGLGADLRAELRVKLRANWKATSVEIWLATECVFADDTKTHGRILQATD